MKVGVPGEFHEDRWPRTAEDSERHVLTRTREADGTHRIQVIAWRRGLLTGLRHGDHAHRCSRAIPAWRRGLVAGFWHGDLAHKYLSAILAWQDCLEPVSNRSLADAPAGLRHGNPVHRCLCGIPAWRSGLQSTLRHSDPTHRYSSAISAWRDHLLSTLLSRDPAHRYARAVSPWRSSHLSVHSSMKWALFVDVEVWIGCSSMKWVLFVDVEVRSGCSDGPSPRLLHPQVDQGHPRDKGGGTIASGVSVERVRFGIERWSSNIGRAIAWFIGGATGQNHRQRSGSLFRQSLPAVSSGILPAVSSGR